MEVELNGHRSQFLVLMMLAIGLMTSLAISGETARAQPSATPGAVSPDPAACTVDPLTFDDISAIFASATPAAEATPTDTITVSVGSPADTDAYSAVAATLHMAVACLDGGDIARFLALLTPHAAVTTFPWIGSEIARGNLNADSLVPQPVPADMQQTVLAIGGVNVLEDGRYAAVMIILDPQSGDPSPQALHFVLVKDGDRLLIDEVAEFEIDSGE